MEPSERGSLGVSGSWWRGLQLCPAIFIRMTHSGVQTSVDESGRSRGAWAACWVWNNTITILLSLETRSAAPREWGWTFHGNLCVVGQGNDCNLRLLYQCITFARAC